MIVVMKEKCKDAVTCSGRGRVRVTKNIEVDIPAGIDHGQI